MLMLAKATLLPMQWRNRGPRAMLVLRAVIYTYAYHPFVTVGGGWFGVSLRANSQNEGMRRVR